MTADVPGEPLLDRPRGAFALQQIAAMSYARTAEDLLPVG
jgi:hypothetical protein